MNHVDFTGFENRTMNDIDIQRELVSLSETLFASYHENLNNAIAKADFEQVHAIAHKAKTGASLLGMTNIHEAYQTIELQTATGNSELVNAETISVLIDSFNSALRELKSYINSKLI